MSAQDFGSAREARVVVRNRQQALAQQEDAEAHCSAPYRRANSHETEALWHQLGLALDS